MAVQAARQQQQQRDGSGPHAAGSTTSSSSVTTRRRTGRPSLISRDSEEDIAAARQRLAAYLQQQGGISRVQAAELADDVTAFLGAAADQLVPAPLQWFVGQGMQPLKAAQLLVRICTSAGQASYIRQWPTWQPVIAANWQLADSCLAAYQQQCRAAKQRPLKGSESMAVMLSSMPSRYLMLTLPDLANKLEMVQQRLELTEAGMGELIAAGLVLTGTEATLAAAMRWLASFAGSKEATVSMLRVAPGLLSYSVAALDSKFAALEAAWAGVLQPEQLRQLVRKAPHVFSRSSSNFAPTAAVLTSWFPQPSDLFAVLSKAPVLLAVPTAILQSNEAWLTGPPLSLSRQQFLALAQARPQAMSCNLAEPLTQHKLAFLAQVGGRNGANAGLMLARFAGLAAVACIRKPKAARLLPCVLCRWAACPWSAPCRRARSTI